MQVHKYASQIVLGSVAISFIAIGFLVFGGTPFQNKNVGWIGAVPVLSPLAGVAASVLLPTLARLLVRVIGRRTDATITNVTSAGAVARSGSRYGAITAANETVVFDVARADNGAYQARETVMVPSKYLHDVRAGARVQVKVNPFYAGHVALMFDSLRGPLATPPLSDSIRHNVGVRATAQLHDAEMQELLDNMSEAGIHSDDLHDVSASLRELKSLRDSGTITQADFDAKKAELLSRL